MALWLYAAVDGVGNGRKLDRLCREHDAYKWLCGAVSLNYHTLNDFRVEHGQALDDLFTQVLTALIERKVVQVKRISQDGKRVRASAGWSSFHREQTLRRRLEQVRRYLEELKREPDEAPATSVPLIAAQSASLSALCVRQTRLVPPSNVCGSPGSITNGAMKFRGSSPHGPLMSSQP